MSDKDLGKENFIDSKENMYVYKNHKKLRFGYTTGSCAAAASKASIIMLLSKKTIKKIQIMTPKGILLNLNVLDITFGEDFVKCAIKKDSGDDPDVTNGILVYSKVQFSKDKDIIIDGGMGVGRVTKDGLQCKKGSAAINKVPREMIYKEVKNVCEEFEYKEGLYVEISIPEGVEIAKKTFNPRLGIEGGISILGTSGIIEPMSEKALIDTIKVEMKQLKVNGAEYLLITPGNYGESFSRENMEINIENSLKCSNFVGETLDYACEIGVKGILFIAHIGKFIKIAGGIMNTHSKNADCRMEILAAHAGVCGANSKTIKAIMNCITTDEAIEILEKEGLKDKTMKSISKKIDFYLKNRIKNEFLVGAVVFSNKYGILCETEDVKELIINYR